MVGFKDLAVQASVLGKQGSTNPKDLTEWQYLPQHPTALQEQFDQLGFCNLGLIYRNLPVPILVEQAVQRGEGVLTDNGALSVTTGQYTGRSPHDRFIVKEPLTQDIVDWNQSNVPISEAHFEQLLEKMHSYVQRRELFVFDGFVGADSRHRRSVRVINELAYQNLFAHQLFIRPHNSDLDAFEPDFTVIAMPGLKGDPDTDGLNSEAFVVLHLSKGLVLIGGTQYSGEIKKSVFSMMNYAMPLADILPMHGAANLDHNGNSALFFGLSGTGKTSLSTDSDHHLIGDDEHGWSPDGIFNFEGGCYAKTIHLSHDKEPQIYNAIHFGTLLENVGMDNHERHLDFEDGHITENTRAAYPLTSIDNSVLSGVAGHPTAIMLLTADAFGVLPPIAKLTRKQAIYHFLSGYTSKLAGTERGVTIPESTFSACFGQCFFPRSPLAYAQLLEQRLAEHPETQVYLVNTGWFGGPYGVGQRMDIQYTRVMVNAALEGLLDQVHCSPHPIFKMLVPEEVPGVPGHLLDPKGSWPDTDAYDEQAQALARQFMANFQAFGAERPDLMAGGPSLVDLQ